MAMPGAALGGWHDGGRLSWNDVALERHGERRGVGRKVWRGDGAVGATQRRTAWREMARLSRDFAAKGRRGVAGGWRDGSRSGDGSSLGSAIGVEGNAQRRRSLLVTLGPGSLSHKQDAPGNDPFGDEGTTVTVPFVHGISARHLFFDGRY